MSKLFQKISFLFLAAIILGACDPPAEESADDQNAPETMIGRALEGEVTRDADPGVDETAFETFAADNRDFAFALFTRLRDGQEDEQDNGNLFVSPHSISTALAMVFAGADGATREQMAEVLRFTLAGSDLHNAFNRLDLALAARADFQPDREGDAFRLDVVNQTWGQQDFNFQTEYLDLLARHYAAGVRLVDFAGAFEAIRVAINQWVEEQTEERIRDLLPPRTLNADTRFVLVNAIYFLGSWKHAFDEDNTEAGPFRRLDGSTVDVPLMSQAERFGYFHDEDTVGVSMPYIGDDVALVALMPAGESADFPAWEADFERARFDAVIAGLQTREVRVYFPKFESGSDVRLAEVLEAMGMVDAFDECAADFRGITGVDPCIPDRSLYIDEIFHKSFVNIDEAGTEAAAATAVVMMRTTAAAPQPPTVRFDRPFYYTVYDRPTGTILFLGRMLDPGQE